MSIRTCPRCDRSHHPTHAVGRFTPTGCDGYRPAFPDAPLLPTRADAEAAQCSWQAGQRPVRQPNSGVIYTIDRFDRLMVTTAGDRFVSRGYGPWEPLDPPAEATDPRGPMPGQEALL